MPNFICLKLSTGDVVHLDAGSSVSNGPEMVRDALGRARDGWLNTREETVVNASQIAEAWLVLDAPEPMRRGQRPGGAPGVATNVPRPEG